MEILTHRQMQEIERLARKAHIDRLLTFFESRPRIFFTPRKTLLGSNNEFDVYIEGLTTRSTVTRELANMDEPYNPNTRLERTTVCEKRAKRVTPNPTGLIFEEVRNGLPAVCLANSLGECDGPVIQAHTIQKASFAEIAVGGHVYHLDPFKKHKDVIRANRVGINDATTFPCFCGRHDNDLFAPIEKGEFEFTDEQFLLHHLRAIARTYYERKYLTAILPRMYSQFVAENPRERMTWLEERISLNESDIRECESRLLAALHAVERQDFSSIETRCWVGTVPPSLFTCELFGPRRDMTGRTAQNNKSWGRLAWVSLTVTAYNKKAVVMISGDKGCAVFQQLTSSLDSLPAQECTQAVGSYVICQFENVILAPMWWEGLDDRDRNRFCAAMMSKYFPRTLPRLPDWSLRPLTS